MKPYLCILFPIFLTACASNNTQPGATPPEESIVFKKECKGVPFDRYRDQTVNLTYDQTVEKSSELNAALAAGTEELKKIDASAEIGAGTTRSTKNNVTGTAVYKSIVTGEEAKVKSAFQDTFCTTLAFYERPELTQAQRDQLFEVMVKSIKLRQEWITAPSPK
ncbi:hypothetical protein [Marinobacter sp. F4218]|uniref:hypothetical protein n=1 Tax=Marinobacter sp. F4218 TaxID=2862868 RepID=UPI001C634D15|nr:hypothetical protein [Marinobacter sp. F4218]MBW7471161.1 hypothetical protein [Marinobacter sp. F4218]